MRNCTPEGIQHVQQNENIVSKKYCENRILVMIILYIIMIRIAYISVQIKF